LDQGVDLNTIEKFSSLPPGASGVMAEATRLAGEDEFSGEKYPVDVGRVKLGSRSVRFCSKFNAIRTWTEPSWMMTEYSWALATWNALAQEARIRRGMSQLDSFKPDRPSLEFFGYLHNKH
jgi:hypothetical protein